MNKVYVFLADGFEEIEALAVVDILRRAQLDVAIVGVGGPMPSSPIGAHQIQVAMDIHEEELDVTEVDAVILPGGMPGTLNLEKSNVVQQTLRHAMEHNLPVGAICAAPSIFGKHGMLTNIKATCFPGFESQLLNAVVTDASVVTDGVFTTARDYEAATEFAKELVKICEILGIEPKEELDAIEEAK